MRPKRAQAAAAVLCFLVIVIAVLLVIEVRAPDRGGTAEAGRIAITDHRHLWHCGMHPQVIQDHPGDCPICHMPLTPMNSGADAGDNEVTVDPRMVQDMGVQTALVTRGPIHKTIRAVGLFKLPEPGLHDITLKVGGWIDKLYADQEGMHVHQSEPLFALYSPELQVAQQELIGAAKARRSLPTGAGRTLIEEADGLVVSARRKLQLWDVDPREIAAAEQADQPLRDVTFYSPATGHLEDKMVVQGSAVQPGMKLMRVADHTRMWLDAQVYADDLPLVAVGQTVKVNAEGMAAGPLAGKVSFLYPHLDHMTRTLTVRVTFDNPDFALKPGMYADVEIVTEPVRDALQVPQEAVIDTGTKQIVFVAEDGGHFSLRSVRIGVRGDDERVQVLEGLGAGETVVTSGQFLMDVESRTQEAIAKMRGTSVEPAGPAGTETETRPPATAPTTQANLLWLVFCPMAKADWLQPTGPIANPYMSAQMRDCGEVKAELAAPPRDSSLAPVLDAYLAVWQSLVAGRVDVTATQRLKSAATQLSGDAYASLRQATEKLAAMRDLKTTQSQLKAVSAALVPLLQEPHKR